MGLPAFTSEPLEPALRTKVRELFGEDARLHSGLTFDREPLLEIHTVLGVDAAHERMDKVYDWVIEQYPYAETVVGLRHVRGAIKTAETMLAQLTRPQSP